MRHREKSAYGRDGRGSSAKMNRGSGVKMNFRWKSARGCDIMSSDIISHGNVSM